MISYKSSVVSYQFRWILGNATLFVGKDFRFFTSLRCVQNDNEKTLGARGHLELAAAAVVAEGAVAPFEGCLEAVCG